MALLPIFTVVRINNITHDNDVVKFSKFVQITHWVGYVAAMLLTTMTHDHAPSVGLYMPLGLLTASAVGMWHSARNQPVDVSDVAWEGACILWCDAIVYASIPLLVYGGVDIQSISHPVIYILVGFAAIPAVIKMIYK